MKIEIKNKTFQIGDTAKLELIYFQVTDLWKRLCQEHTRLFDLTCKEYVLLLESKMDELDELVKDKQVIIDSIADIDQARRDLIDVINQELLNNNSDHVQNITDLLLLMQQFETERAQRHLFGFNSFLIEVIEQIQNQNKKNQLFLNKALMSLKEIREDVIGQKSCKMYTPTGTITSSTHNMFTTTRRELFIPGGNE